jgi:transposase InsO family protein
MDITYISMAKGYMYLSAIMDVNSRYVLSWTYPTQWKQCGAET